MNWKLRITIAIFLNFLERILMLHTQIIIHILQSQCGRHMVWILVPEMSQVFPSLPSLFLATKYLNTCNSQFSFWQYFLFMGTGGVGRTAGETPESSSRRISTLLLIPWALPGAASHGFESDFSWDDAIKDIFSVNKAPCPHWVLRMSHQQSQPITGTETWALSTGKGGWELFWDLQAEVAIAGAITTLLLPCLWERRWEERLRSSECDFWCEKLSHHSQPKAVPVPVLSIPLWSCA